MKPSGHESRQKQFKNLGRHEEMRRRRTEGSLELRKQKKDDTMMKRRNVNVEEVADEVSEVEATEEGTTTLPNAEGGDQNQPQSKRPPHLTVAECAALLQGQPSEQQILQSIEGIRRILSRSKNPPVQDVINHGLVPALIQAATLPNADIQFESAWALTNIVSGTADETAVVVQNGGLEPLIHLLRSSEWRIVEQAAWAIGNIIGDCARYRDMVIAAGGATALVGMMSHLDKLNADFIRTLSWIFSNLCRHKDPHPPVALLKQIAPQVITLAQHSDKQTNIDACWALSYITDGSDDEIQVLLDHSDILSRLHTFLLSGEPGLIAPSLRTFGNIVTGTDAQTQAVIDASILPTIGHVMETGSGNLVKECCWLLSNVLAGPKSQIQAVIDADLVPIIVECLDRDAKTQIEASWCISNMCQGGDHRQIMLLVECGVIPLLCKYLDANSSKLVLNLLDTMWSLCNSARAQETLEPILLMIEESGGIDKLEALQTHENEQVFAKAVAVIETYFNDETEEKENLNPNNQATDDNNAAVPAPPAGGFAF